MAALFQQPLVFVQVCPPSASSAQSRQRGGASTHRAVHGSRAIATPTSRTSLLGRQRHEELELDRQLVLAVLPVAEVHAPQAAARVDRHAQRLGVVGAVGALDDVLLIVD